MSAPLDRAWTGCGIGWVILLAFWEFSWDLMKSIAFFVTTTSIAVGYAYVLSVHCKISDLPRLDKETVSAKAEKILEEAEF